MVVVASYLGQSNHVSIALYTVEDECNKGEDDTGHGTWKVRIHTTHVLCEWCATVCCLHGVNTMATL